MQSNFLHSFLSIFGFDHEEKRRIDEEWEKATEQMRADTESIRQLREEHDAKLYAAKLKLMEGKTAMHARLSHDDFMMAKEDEDER